MFGNFLFNIVQYCKQDNTLDVASYSKLYTHTVNYILTLMCWFLRSLWEADITQKEIGTKQYFSSLPHIIGVGTPYSIAWFSFLSFLLSVLFRCQLWLRTCCRIRLHEPESSIATKAVFITLDKRLNKFNFFPMYKICLCIKVTVKLIMCSYILWDTIQIRD